MLAEQIIKLLIAERQRQGLSQREVADRIGCHVTFVQRIESNQGDRQVSGFDRYAAALGISLGVTLAPSEVQSRG